MKYLLSLGIVLFSVPLSASEIILEQVTLRRGMEGDTRQSGALDDPKTCSKNRVYREEKELAAKRPATEARPEEDTCPSSRQGSVAGA
ncbi:hypothetical protein [Mesorhizobium sp.]|uniref:hypothetical protein n=1 Tax=Mesorhizobium sp. TaxID=1871066 RepID=UPI000FEA56D4|nr:hypothetical protein [Mesorhizobium sp.]RWO98475.1 MAG: hypothetical protein EOQ99_30005 [Mesorhizobium sp.]